MKTIRTLLLLGLVGSVMGSISDLLLLYSPNGGYFDQTYNFMLDVNWGRLFPAQLIGVPFLPLQILGFIALYLLYRKEQPKLSLAVLVLASWAMCMGTAYHGMLAFINIYKQSASAFANPTVYNEGYQLMRMLNEPFAGFVIIGFTVACLLLVTSVLKSDILPKWVGYLSPLTFYIIMLVLYGLNTGVGNFLMMTGFNLSIGLFFIVVLSQLSKAKL